MINEPMVRQTTDNGQTIAAIATPAGSGGIGIIKISGQDAIKIAMSVVSGPWQRTTDNNRRLCHGHVVHPETGQVLDEVLAAVMRAPHSYTGEDVAEIQAHAGQVVLRLILDMVLCRGARLAEPGEFTKRAYLNGRIDLTQAEAVIDIIHAKTEKSLAIAAAQVRGGMRERIESVRERLLYVLTRTEAAIDFPEEVGDTVNTGELIRILEHEVIRESEKLLTRYKDASFLREGLKVLIVGKPNVGKSSLMNGLLEKDRAIVTPVPGTTRDSIEEMLNIRGIPVVITDTAGLHSTDDPVELLGIKKTCEHIGNADIILLITDMSQPLTDDDHSIYGKISHKEIILVANKSDLTDDSAEPALPDGWDIPVVKTSAIYGNGLDMLRDRITGSYVDEDNEAHTIVPNLRHKLWLERGVRAASSAADGIGDGMPFELVSIDLRESVDAMGQIIGITVREDVLDEIFSRFCIGK
ncbi:tRNA uridine-5-carboxymethylaminomethyl(34) synthesis GTPase MnmE [Desulfococcaceae bacterium HSG8]|nr:tRNA uridine-5-carboxymethylaminomethyl(34) synthesis GTPase MnmE [Desulfococcaceae bacterium HSG8]